MKTAVALLALLAASGDLSAAPRQAAPCRDCVLSVPDHPAGLLVVLHGDDTGASAAFIDWREAARRADLALLAPQCPSDRGCEGSWWRWALSARHDPEWLDAQIAAVASAARIDRVYVAGFSGGASYLAGWAPAHAGAISRVAFVSGGYPATDRCPAQPLSTLFLIGGVDPMIATYVRPLAAWLRTCANVEIAWRVVPRLGHAAMHAALRNGRAAEVVSWLVDSR
jgi:poly(3-hydroxybutyrate) depolymerase